MADLNPATNGRPRLVLLIDADLATRQLVAPILASNGLELVQARESMAGLEILQRLPERFQLAIVSLEMPGLPGAAVIGTLRLFRPELAVVCLTGAEPATAASATPGCLTKPVQADALREQVSDALLGRAPAAIDLLRISSEVVERARAAFGRSRSLLDAAREIAAGLPGPATEGW
jgi:DNA-binding NtrC family response regulator